MGKGILIAIVLVIAAAIGAYSFFPSEINNISKSFNSGNTKQFFGSPNVDLKDVLGSPLDYGEIKVEGTLTKIISLTRRPDLYFLKDNQGYQIQLDIVPSSTRVYDVGARYVVEGRVGMVTQNNQKTIILTPTSMVKIS